MAASTPYPQAPLSTGMVTLLRRCPLLPSELTGLEGRLLELLMHAPADDLGIHLSHVLRDLPVGARAEALRHALTERAVAPLTVSTAWRDECGRVVSAVVNSLGRLHGRRATALALYAVFNLAAGEVGTQVLFWAQQILALPGMLRDARVLPWLSWLCQLPLPTLREHVWGEALAVGVSGWLEPLLEQADVAQDALHRSLQLPASPLRLMLLGSVWALWFRQQRHAPAAEPVTTVGRHLARLPGGLEALDHAGTAARRLFAAPPRAMALPVPLLAPPDPGGATSAAETARLLAPALPIVLAAATALPALPSRAAQRRAVYLGAGLAAATAGAGFIRWQLHIAYTAAVQHLGEQIDASLYRAPATHEAWALGEALWQRMAVLAGPAGSNAPTDPAAVAARVQVVLDLPDEQHAGSYRQALRAVCGLEEAVNDAVLDAAAGWALRRSPRALSPPVSVPVFLLPRDAAQHEAASRDRAGLIEALWRLRDAASAGHPSSPALHRFQPAEGSPFALAVQAVRQRLVGLYCDDDFINTLYAERTPPDSLVVTQGVLTGARTGSGTVVVLHSTSNPTDGAAWAPSTTALLTRLQRAVLDAGTCFDNTVPARLDCALGFYLDRPAPTAALTAGALDVLIHRLEQALQQPVQGHITPANETASLVRLHQQVQYLKSVPIRGLEPPWGSWPPDPRSHLGHNVALARGLLLQLSQHAAMITLCWQRNADPSQLVYPASGQVVARAVEGTHTVSLFDASAPPAALDALGTLLRGLATLLQAPVRSNGQLRVPEMLAYYGVPLPAVPLEDAQFDACLAGLERQIARPQEPVEAPARLRVEWNEQQGPAERQDHQQVLDLLWRRIEAQPAVLDSALADQHVVPGESSPLHAAWQSAQQALREVFEQPELWRHMRRVNASFHSLRVGADGVTARTRPTGRTVLLVEPATSLHPRLSGLLDVLYRTTDRLGRFSPGDAVPLANALQFHGALPRPGAAPCTVPQVCTQAVLLDAIARIHERWQRHAPALSDWHQAGNELQEVRRLLTHRPGSAVALHRPGLGTTTMTVLQPAWPAFARLFIDADVQALLAAGGAGPTCVVVEANGSVHLHGADGTRSLLDLGQAALERRELDDALHRLRDVAGRLGGQVRSDGRVNVSELLAVHGGCGPQELDAADGAAQCTERLLGELRLGMRADLVHAGDVLDPAGHEQVRQATAAFMAQHAPAGQLLLEYLGAPLVERGELRWDEPQRSSHAVACMARSPRALALQTALLQSLGWYLGSDAAPVSPTLLASLTRVAIVLDLGPPTDRDARILLGYRLHKPSNWGRTFAGIRQDFHDYLRSMGRIPASLLDLAGTLALQDLAPELLGVDVPDNLVYANTIASINVVSGVHLAERIRRGLSQQMRFSELVTLSADLSGDSEAPGLVKQLALQARRLPTLDWYVFRQLELQSGQPPGLPINRRIEAALKAFDERVADIERAIDDVLAPLPYRMQLVQAAIHRVFPRFPGVLARHAWNSSTFLLCNDDEPFGRRFPFHELVAAGALRDPQAHWRPCRTFVLSSPIYQAQGDPQYDAAVQDAYRQMRPGLAALDDINHVYQARFDTYFQRAQRGYGLLIEEALYQRPEAERAALLRGDVTVYTLRTHVPDLEAQQETRDDTDPYRGRFGVVYTLMLSGKPHHFQLFPLRSRIIPLAVEGPLPLGGALHSRKVRLRSGNVATVRVRRGTSLPVDWHAYATDKAPANGTWSEVIVDPLPWPGAAAEGGVEGRSPFHRLVDPVQHTFFWLDQAAFRREGWAPTSFEAHLEDKPLWLKTVDFFVPFVENLRSITSRNRNEFAMAAFGLYLESIIVVGPVIGGVVKVLARPGMRMTMPRVAELSRVLARGTLDALNPAAGSLAMLRLGVAVVQRTARGNLRFLWPLMDPGHPAARGIGMRWVMSEGMAIAKDGNTLAASLYSTRMRTVDGIPNVLVGPVPVVVGGRPLYLTDPATLSLYGPPLEERLGSGGGAAGVLFKAGSSAHAPHVSPGKALKPIKQGPKASEEEPDDNPAPLQPPGVFLPGLQGRRPAGEPP
ncbi:hypothetical protein [Stenotrophomonas sp.]|uniref:hypothetical protein n=1 Tax=Stenotrophomonas sp. TaxID=69392 RepID=UPI0028B23660|nr:hypothetical protein [Stenotrophomonas sp.]